VGGKEPCKPADAVRETVKGNEQWMEAAARNFPEYICLQSIFGFGPIISAMVLAIIGNTSRFGIQNRYCA
jgi:hypothetical protein